MHPNNTCPVCSGEEWVKKHDITDHFLSHEHFSLLKCSGCGLLQTAPRPGNLQDYYKSEEYLSHSDRKDSLTDRFYHWVREKMLNRKAQWLMAHTAHTDRVLLDFGCGTGYFLHHMQEKNWEVHGIEAEKEARNFAASKFHLSAHAKTDELPADLRFSAITLWHVLEHIPDITALLNDLCERLKGGGLLVLALPNPASSDARIYGELWAAWDVPRHLWHFQPRQVYQLAGQHGLKHLQTYRLPFDAFYVSLLSEKHRKSSLPLLRAFWNGSRSWLSSLARLENTSSLVYVFQKD